MDRHVEFVTQLARLVQHYVREPGDLAAEKAALRAARAAAKHGAVSMAFEESVLRAGAHAVSADEIEQLPLLHDALVAAGITSIDVAHHAKQAEIKALARLLARVVQGELQRETFAAALQEQPWDNLRVQLAALEAGTAAEMEEAVPAVVDEVGVETASEAAPPEESSEAEAEGEAPEERVLGAGPIATMLPPAALALDDPAHRQLFERLISSSEPGTLRLFIDPVQLAVEQSMREGRPLDALKLLLAFLECEELAEDPEMRRQFVVALRRLTKPMLLRGLAMLFADEPACADGAERVMRRFGEDGAEAVIDRIACAPSLQLREQYTGVLRRLPSARDAIIEMVDDDHDFVVERAVELAVGLKFSDADRVLGDQLNHPWPRVRRAVARGLAEFPGSAFALDALLRALKDGAVEVRLAAAVALQQRRDPRLAAALVERFDEEPELEVQLALIVAMGRLGAIEGVQKLVALTSPDARQLRRRDGASLRLSAMEALGEARTPQSMVTLQKLLEDRDKDVRETAARLYSRARRQTSTASIPAVSEP